MTSIYSIQPRTDGVDLAPVWTQADSGLAAGYTALVPVKVGDTTALYAYDRSTGQTDVYELTADKPWVARTDAKPELAGKAWDSLGTFVLGNDPYLMTYERERGTFGFFPIRADLSVGKPYLFAMPRNTPTKGFTTVAAYASLSTLTVTGYDFDTGIVANYSLAVLPSTPRATPGVPPLLAQNLWYHQWAKGWTRFAFFQLGGGNFFFKINTAKLNVNIDHMQDDPSKGSVEVGSYLQAQLPDALQITHSASVPWAHGEPYLLTYIAGTGAAVVYRIHADCQGWTAKAEATVETDAANVITYRVGETSYALFYRNT